MATYHIDQIDQKILSFLVKNARMPFLEIARECGVSGAAIHQRVKRLEANGVITGSPDDETWTCTQSKSSQSIDNPIKANALRINAMRNLLGMEAPEILSLTVFPNANIDAVRSMQVADYSLAEQFLNIKIGLRHYSREEVERFNGMFRKFRKEHGLSFERYLKELAATS